MKEYIASLSDNGGDLNDIDCQRRNRKCRPIKKNALVKRKAIINKKVEKLRNQILKYGRRNNVETK